MKEWVKEIVEAEKEKKKILLEVKFLNKDYNLHHSTTRWDKRVKI